MKSEMRNGESLVIRDYDPSWPVVFSKLATEVMSALGSLVVAIEHIGSTAVPGLAAKPIIDLDVVLASSADLPEAIRLLTTLGYAHQGNLGVPGREAFRCPPGEPRHHLYVLIAGANELRRHLAFRDALRSSEDLRIQYTEHKRALAKAYQDDRSGYTDAKTDFITSVVGTRSQMPKTTDAVDPLRARLSADLLTAMKARDKPVVDTLRCLLAVLDNAGAQDPKAFGSSTEAPRKSLTHNELQALMQAELASRSAAIVEYERGGRHQEAARLRAELVLVSRYVE
jgi:GrpB-like predicted nucleotidyltransferase (UPF0157 family)